MTPRDELGITMWEERVLREEGCPASEESVCRPRIAPASFWRRLVSGLIDALVLIIFLVFFQFAIFGWLTQTDMQYKNYIIICGFICFLYEFIMYSLCKKTIGKYLSRTMLECQSNNRYKAIFVRTTLHFVPVIFDMLFLISLSDSIVFQYSGIALRLIDCLFILNDDKKRTFHDLLSGTFVCMEK